MALSATQTVSSDIWNIINNELEDLQLGRPNGVTSTRLSQCGRTFDTLDCLSGFGRLRTGGHHCLSHCRTKGFPPPSAKFEPKLSLLLYDRRKIESVTF